LTRLLEIAVFPIPLGYYYRFWAISQDYGWKSLTEFTEF
jgi:hypothetical protein